MNDGETLITGRHRLRFIETPHVPHNWDASLLFDETERVLWVSDLLLQRGNPPSVVAEILGAAVQALEDGQRSPFHDPLPYARTTAPVFERLAALAPRTLAVMHGASYHGDGATVLRSFHAELRRLFAAGA